MVCWTWVSRAGVQPLWEPVCPLSTTHFLEKWPVVVFSTGSCGKPSRQVGWVAEDWGARVPWMQRQPLTALSQPTGNLALTAVEQNGLTQLLFCFLSHIFLFYWQKQVFHLLSTAEPTQGADSPASRRRSTALAASSFFRGTADADKQIPAGRKIKSWCLIWGLTTFTSSFERSPLNQHRRLSSCAHMPLL